MGMDLNLDIWIGASQKYLKGGIQVEGGIITNFLWYQTTAKNTKCMFS